MRQSANPLRAFPALARRVALRPRMRNLRSSHRIGRARPRSGAHVSRRERTMLEPNARGHGPRARARAGARAAQAQARGGGGSRGLEGARAGGRRGPDGFFLRSADAKYQIRFRGYTQLDSRWFSEADDVVAPRQLLLPPRAPDLRRHVAGFVDFRIMPDFANSTLVLQDAYANLRFSPEAQLQVGKFKSPFGLERLESATAMWFVERAFPTLLVPNRDLGVMLQGTVREGLRPVPARVPEREQRHDDHGHRRRRRQGLRRRACSSTRSRRRRIEPLQGLGIGFATTYGRPQGAPGTIRVDQRPDALRVPDRHHASRATARAARRRPTGTGDRSRCSASTCTELDRVPGTARTSAARRASLADRRRVGDHGREHLVARRAPERAFDLDKASSARSRSSRASAAWTSTDDAVRRQRVRRRARSIPRTTQEWAIGAQLVPEPLPEARAQLRAHRLHQRRRTIRTTPAKACS